jgi:hypothetical protein
MPIEIVKFNKSLSLIDDEVIEVSDSMTIDHYADTIKSAEGEVEFIIYSTNCQIPEIDEVKYSVVIREKVDLTAQGPNDVLIKERDKDNGNKNFKDHKPCIPTDLPPGFIQLKGEQ